ncbi:hypothetical protein Pla175_36020 [Pirellulimonas nuda]|uniref:DUF2513 domain-containing protein n=1 Tax=Pirellulimonas nuda TaxID=2528009 RepID=A0A518DFF7_9BACT|nr:DUF2513 domain-containing protein [Pirellulimonas nuda]QDU90200.1 hypothetical protein Pla175_36020 [Pirellulimonas nuda]
MKRDIDLTRQLLLDIEGHGPDCSLGSLRSGQAQDADERIRYHLRLLIDAGMVKELDRTAAGVPCVRLTHAGHELAELVRSEARWREAKWLVQEQTGGLSLTVIKAVLVKWAVDGVVRSDAAIPRRPYYRPAYRPEPRYRYERDSLIEDELRLVRTRPDYRERYDGPRYEAARYEAARYEAPRPHAPRYETRDRDYFYPGYARDVYDVEVDAAEPTVGVALPIHLV